MATFASNQLTATCFDSYNVEPELLIIFICGEWDQICLSGRNGLQHDDDNTLVFEIGEKGKKKRALLDLWWWLLEENKKQWERQ